MRKFLNYLIISLLSVGYVFLTRWFILTGLGGNTPSSALASLYTIYFCMSIPIFLLLIKIINGVFDLSMIEISELNENPSEGDGLRGVEESFNRCYHNCSGMSKDFNKGYTEAILDFLDKSGIKYELKENEESSLKILCEFYKIVK